MRLGRRGLWLGSILILVGLSATIQRAWYMKSMVDAEAERALQANCDEIVVTIQKRLKDHETVLRSGAAFYAHAGHVRRQEWHSFIQLQHIDQWFPGVQGIGFAQLIPRQELAQHLHDIRAEGFPTYQVHPEGEREIYSSIIFLEPFTDRNLRAFGYDMLSEPIRRAAMERARDHDEAALSGRVMLVQETGQDVQAGTLMYMPVYRSEMPTITLDQRRAALAGWVYSPFRMNDLMYGIIGEQHLARNRNVHLKVFDGGQASPATLLYDSLPGGDRPKGAAAHLPVQRVIVLAGRPWTLDFTRINEHESPLKYREAWTLLAGGTSISLLLTGLFFSLLNTQLKAKEMAEQLTAELRASEQKYHAIADYTVGWETWFGMDGKILWVSPGVEKITGYSPAEVLAMPDFISRIIAPDEPNDLAPKFNEAMRGGSGDGMEFQFVRKNGAKFWLSVSWQPIFDSNGNALGARASGRDITELKQVVAKLHRANWVVEQAKSSIIITDKTGRIEYVNAEFIKVSGYSREEVMGRNPRFKQSGETSRATYQELWQALGAGHSWQGEFRNRRKNGELYWEAVVISPIRDVNGHVTHYAGIQQDVSERKKAEKVAAEHLSNFRTFFESMTDMIFVGSPDGKLIFTNQAVTQTLGYSPEDLATMHLLDVHPTDQRQEAETIFAAMFRGERESCPMPLRGKDGGLVPVDTRIWFGQWDGANCIFGISKNLSSEQEAQQRFERLFRHNPSLMALSALPDQQFHDVNDAFLKVLGYSMEDVVGKTSVELNLFPQTASQVTVAEKLLRDGRIANVELQVRRKDGTFIVGLFSGEMIRSQGRQFLLTVMNDITEMKRMEEALKEAGEHLRLAVQAGGVGIWNYDVAKNLLVWDAQMYRLYGVTPEQFGGAYDAWLVGVHPEDRQRGDHEIQLALRGEKNFDTEFRVVWPDGSIHDIRALATVQHDATGKPARMVGTNWDLTAERQAAAALRWNRELLQLMSGSSPLGFLVVDNRTDSILYFNQRFCEIWSIEHLADRLRRDELKNNDIIPYCLSVLADVPAFAASCVPLQDEMNRSVVEDEIAFTRDRTIRRFSSQIRDAEDRYHGRFYIFEDITERKRRETENAALLEKERQVSEMKTRFISITSHEFRTPMAAAMGSVDLLTNHFERFAPAKRLQLLARVNSSLLRMVGMLDEILLLNRLDEKRIEVHPTSVDLGNFLHDLVEEIHLGDRDAHRFELLAPKVSVSIIADTDLLHHIFSNVLSNAVRYSPAGTLITVQLQADAERVQVAVEDQGIGITPGDRVRIFEPFERGSNVGQINGTGLGLNIVKRMTEMLGGTIAVDSTEGRGTRFTFFFAREPALAAHS